MQKSKSKIRKINFKHEQIDNRTIFDTFKNTYE